MRRERHPRDECFGLPNSSAIAGIRARVQWEINVMAVLVVLFGVLVISGTLYRVTRS
jgi:hypothetical protein